MGLLDFKCSIKFTPTQEAIIRSVTIDDINSLKALYMNIYDGLYPLPIVTSPQYMKHAIQDKSYLWLVCDVDGLIKSSVILAVNEQDRIGKAFGAVVSADARGRNLTAQSLSFGIDLLVKKYRLVDTVYATTRTISPAPQKLVIPLGFKQLGIFPNVRKLEKYETHCLAAYFTERAIDNRLVPPHLLTEIVPLYQICSKELPLGPFKSEKYVEKGNCVSSPINFEAIEAQNFIQHRFVELKGRSELAIHFFPFHIPNLLLTTKDLRTEVYIHYSKKDRHCVIIGLKTDRSSYFPLLEAVSNTLEEFGVRYIEMIIDAYNPKLQYNLIKSRFIPSAYYPAMRCSGGMMLDYIVFSKSFEILDFQNVELTGLYKQYLFYYYNMWKKLYIDEVFDDMSTDGNSTV